MAVIRFAPVTKARGFRQKNPQKRFAVQLPCSALPKAFLHRALRERATRKRAVAAETLRRNLTMGSVVIYCTRVARDIGMVLERYTLV
jgi:hypothetical protein